MSEQQNLQSNDIFAAIVRDSDDAVFSQTVDAVITSWNPAAERMYGYAANEVIGQHVSILLPTNPLDDLKNIVSKMGKSLHHYETVRQHKDGRLIDVALTISPIRNRQGHIVGASTIARDITVRRQAERNREEWMSHLAYHDPVTGLPNRVLFKDRLAQALSAAHRHRDRLAVVFIDLDNFKSVNDRLGHGVGDALLKGESRYKECGNPASTIRQFVLRFPKLSRRISRCSVDSYSITAVIVCESARYSHFAMKTIVYRCESSPDFGHTSPRASPKTTT